MLFRVRQLLIGSQASPCHELNLPSASLLQSCLTMQAACYGRAFCSADSFPRDRIVTVCRQLRILNALRQPDVGLPLTAAQVR